MAYKTLPSTQKYLDISAIKNDCLILKDGSLRAVLLVSSVNFALKSEEEQKAIISGYVQFLNSLHFPIQIIIQSRKLNITPYLEDLERQKKEQTNELLGVQMADYIDYVRELVELGDIMSKKFYLAVPYSPIGDKRKNFFQHLTDVFSAPTLVRLSRTKFEKCRTELFKRVEYIMAGLESMGLTSVPLNTQSLIELFYSSYNPKEAITEKLGKMEKLRVEE